MTLHALLLNIEIQSEYKIVYYDYEEEQRIEVPSEHYSDKEIKYLYVEDGILYIEVDNEEET